MAKKNKNIIKQDKRFQRHFRKFHNKETTGHPQYVYDETGKEYKVIGITESSQTNGILNIRLKCNPEPNSTKAAHIRPSPSKINKGVRSTKLKGWKFSNEDKKKVQAVIDKHEKKK